MSGTGITTTGLKQIVVRYTNATRELHDRLLEAMQEQVDLVAFFARARLAELFPNAGKMMESIETQVLDGTTFIEGQAIASGLPYLRIHEFGGITKPHDIFPVNAKALRFVGNPSLSFGANSSPTANTDIVFAKVVHHPGSVMPERSYMRYALAIQRKSIRDAFAAAAAGAVGEP